MGKETIAEYSGRVIGTIETDSSGNKTVRNFSGTILGYYKKSMNATTDYTGKILYRGDASAALLFR